MMVKRKMNCLTMAKYSSINNSSSNLLVFSYFYIYLCNYLRKCLHHHHHHQVTLIARISLTLFLPSHPSLLSITPGRSTKLHPISTQSWCIWVLAGRPTLACPYVGIYRRTSLMCSSLLLQQCPPCLVRLIFFKMGGKWPYSCCFRSC